MKPAADGSLVSKTLGLRLVPQGEMLRLIDQGTDEVVPTRAERAEQLQAEVDRLRLLLQQTRKR
jgi:hypothetical protein